MFLKFSNFENSKNITRAHKSRNALALIRFPVLILWFLFFDYLEPVTQPPTMPSKYEGCKVCMIVPSHSIIEAPKQYVYWASLSRLFCSLLSADIHICQFKERSLAEFLTLFSMVNLWNGSRTEKILNPAIDILNTYKLLGFWTWSVIRKYEQNSGALLSADTWLNFLFFEFISKRE